jgi:hypothetical protein
VIECVLSVIKNIVSFKVVGHIFHSIIRSLVPMNVKQFTEKKKKLDIIASILYNNR